jgi:hypothetical protein
MWYNGGVVEEIEEHPDRHEETDMTYNDKWTDENGKIHNNAFELNPEIIEELDLPHAVGDYVMWNRDRGVNVVSGVTLEIERISLDHVCGGGHQDSCYQPAYISYHVVYGAKPDGSAVYRGRMHANQMTKVWPKS